MHEWPVCDMTNPDLQRHWKDPCTFKHFPFAHIPFFSHSLWSTTEHLSISIQTKKKYCMTGLRLIPVVGLITLWNPYLYNVFHQRPNRSPEDKNTENFPECWYTARCYRSPVERIRWCLWRENETENKRKVRWKFNTISDDMRVRAGTSVLFTHKMTSLHTLVTPRVCFS